MRKLETFAGNVGDAAALLKAMSNTNRLMILCSILDQEMSVNQLNQNIPLSQSSLSQHLAALRKADLVYTRRESQTIYYSVKSNEASSIIKTLKELFCPETKEEPES